MIHSHPAIVKCIHPILTSQVLCGNISSGWGPCSVPPLSTQGLLGQPLSLSAPGHHCPRSDRAPWGVPTPRSGTTCASLTRTLHPSIIGAPIDCQSFTLITISVVFTDCPNHSSRSDRSSHQPVSSRGPAERPGDLFCDLIGKPNIHCAL